VKEQETRDYKTPQSGSEENYSAVQHELSSLRTLVGQLRRDMKEGKKCQGHDSKALKNMKREMLDLVRDRRRQNERVQLDFNTLMEKGNASEEGRMDLENRVKNLDANLQGGLATIAVAVKNTKVVSDKVGVMELDRKVMEGNLTRISCLGPKKIKFSLNSKLNLLSCFSI
jgi:predicted  nucleic acid-binding Zn-ribbon protein